jgi:hypothetical protein
LEQQSSLAEQSFPAVLHAVLRGLHVPPAQLPLQHAPLLVHAVPSDAHAVASHEFWLQLSEQQSVAAEHAPPAARQWIEVDAHACVAPSQIPEQHALPSAHEAPVTLHAAVTEEALASAPVEPPPLVAPPPDEVPLPPVTEPPQPSQRKEHRIQHHDLRGMRGLLTSSG